MMAQNRQALTAEAIHLRDGGCCQICGATVRFGDVEIDHIWPKARGGWDCPHNLRLTCGACNDHKWAALPSEHEEPPVCDCSGCLNDAERQAIRARWAWVETEVAGQTIAAISAHPLPAIATGADLFATYPQEMDAMAVAMAKLLANWWRRQQQALPKKGDGR